MSRGDEIIHQQTRLQIMATLCALRHGESIEFTRLKAIVQATDGNLGAHIATLEGAALRDAAKRWAKRLEVNSGALDDVLGRICKLARSTISAHQELFLWVCL